MVGWKGDCYFRRVIEIQTTRVRVGVETNELRKRRLDALYMYLHEMHDGYSCQRYEKGICDWTAIWRWLHIYINH